MAKPQGKTWSAGWRLCPPRLCRDLLR
jgi:hypothetical protein